MPFSEATKVMLYARSGNLCAHPDCKVGPLVFSLSGSSDWVNHGKAAHIVAEKKDGPRGKFPISDEKRNSVENGIILCTNHHNDVIDKFPEKYPVQLLRKWKREREAQVGDLKTAKHRAKLADDKRYAAFVDRWVADTHLDGWANWTQPLLRGGTQFARADALEDVQRLCVWLKSRVWPKRYRSLNDAFENFTRAFNDFLIVFHRYAEWKPYKTPVWCTEKFYRRHYGKTTAAFLATQKAQDEYDYHVALVEDLLLEVTRAANLICERVREEFDSSFRLDESLVSVVSGPYGDWSFRTHIAQYTQRQKAKGIPYEGLRKFMRARTHRDVHFGEGIRSIYFES